jgi:tetratricopeptide (TPR) repeat protein
VAPLERAVKLNPKNAVAWAGLARARSATDPEGCIDAARKALDLGFASPDVSHLLGRVLLQVGRIPESMAAFRDALKSDPNHPEYLVSLAQAQVEGGEPDRAIASCQRALADSPGYAPAWVGLAYAQTAKGRFDDALKAMETAHELGRRMRGWQYPSAEGVRAIKRYQTLAQRLPDVLADRDPPADARERAEFAWVCRARGLHAGAVRQYDLAFKKEPKLADDQASRHRFHAAACAALVAAGQCEDDPRPTAEALAGYREKALGWLRDDLAAMQKLEAAGNAQARRAVEARLRLWKLTPDLAGVREKATLDKLTEADRREWLKLWADVDELLAKASKRGR